MRSSEGDPPVKLYYRIGEVAELVGVEPHVLRYWESEFPTIRPQKSRSGQRVYSRKDVDKLMRVKDLLYAQRFTIAGARQRLKGSVNEMESTLLCRTPEPDGRGSTAMEPTLDGAGSSERIRTQVAGLRSILLTIREELVELHRTLEDGQSDETPPGS